MRLRHLNLHVLNMHIQMHMEHTYLMISSMPHVHTQDNVYVACELAFSTH